MYRFFGSEKRKPVLTVLAPSCPVSLIRFRRATGHVGDASLVNSVISSMPVVPLLHRFRNADRRSRLHPPPEPDHKAHHQGAPSPRHRRSRIRSSHSRSTEFGPSGFFLFSLYPAEALSIRECARIRLLPPPSRPVSRTFRCRRRPGDLSGL